MHSAVRLQGGILRVERFVLALERYRVVFCGSFLCHSVGHFAGTYFGRNPISFTFDVSMLTRCWQCVCVWLLEGLVFRELSARIRIYFRPKIHYPHTLGLQHFVFKVQWKPNKKYEFHNCIIYVLIPPSAEFVKNKT